MFTAVKAPLIWITLGVATKFCVVSLAGRVFPTPSYVAKKKMNSSDNFIFQITLWITMSIRIMRSTIRIHIKHIEITALNLMNKTFF